MREYPHLTLMYVTHKYSLLEKFDKIFVVDSGRIIENGSFEELKNNGCLFKELYEASRGQ
jgi:ABC-type multidrug transport system fused ATPase/permease subunit